MSARELQDRDAQLIKLQTELHSTVDKVVAGKSTSPKDDLAQANEKLKAYYQGLEFIKLSIRDVDEETKKTYKRKFKDHKKEYTDLLAAVKDQSSKLNRDLLLGGDAEEEEERSTEDAVIGEGDDLLDRNKEILEMTMQRIQEARILGESGIEKLQKQHEQLGSISNNLDEMEDTLKVSQRLIRQIARRMLMDKYIWMLIGLVALAIAAVIYAKQQEKKKK